MDEEKKNTILTSIISGAMFAVFLALGVESVLFMARMVYLIWQVKP